MAEGRKKRRSCWRESVWACCAPLVADGGTDSREVDGHGHGAQEVDDDGTMDERGPFGCGGTSRAQIHESHGPPRPDHHVLATMPFQVPKPVYFGPFQVTPQVFHCTSHSFALVNIRPIVPGHVLVCPHRPVPRLSQLSTQEVADLFVLVQRVGRMVERVYGASSLNIAIQDGEAAGQSVPHLHAHIFPRKAGNQDGDRIYDLMDGEEGDLGGHLLLQERDRRRAKFPFPDEASRSNRSEEEMREEAMWMAREMENEA